MASRPPHTRSTSTNLSSASIHGPLEGKLAIITGASRGIGVAIAHNLAAKGAALVLNYTSDSSASLTHSLATTLSDSFGTKTLVAQADMGSLAGPKHLVELARNWARHPKTGVFRIDILINNAGVSKNQVIEEVEVEEYEKQYRINVLGPLLLMQACLPYLPLDRSGRVVNVSSVSSSEGFIGQSVYGGTKAALEAMTRTWARELAERATVNAVNPGPVGTEMWAGTKPAFKEHLRSFVEHTPLSRVRTGIDEEALLIDEKSAGGRPAYAGEIAGVVGMLCSEDGSWCTGQVVCANGGMRMAI